MHDCHTHNVSDRIASVSQSFLCSHRAGKSEKTGGVRCKTGLSVVSSWTRLEVHFFDAYNEVGSLQTKASCSENGKTIIRVGVLQARSIETVKASATTGARDTALRFGAGSPESGESRDAALDYRNECACRRRAQIQPRKAHCGMGGLTATLQETAAHVIAISVLVLNIRKIWYSSFAPAFLFLAHFHVV